MTHEQVRVLIVEALAVAACVIACAGAWLANRGRRH